MAWNILSTHGLNKKQKEQIRYEIELMKKLQHTNIIKLITAWHSREKEEVVLITEIMTGGSLKHYLQKMRYPRLKLIKQWCKNILSALSYLHSYKPHPIIHRDLKCDNIFVCAHTGEIRIGDFGLSTIMNTSCNKTTVGTPHYMAPELFEERYGPGVDIYSFGMCLIEICTLSTPYKECDSPVSIYKKITSGTKPKAFSRIADEDVRAFIELCLKHVDGRPSADELLEHPFLIIDENDQRTHKPVRLLENEIDEQTPLAQSKHSKPLEISLVLNTQNPQKITFSFNPKEDSTQQVAEEMGTLLHLNKGEVSQVKKCIQLSLESSIIEEGPISPISIPSKGSTRFVEKSSLVDMVPYRNSTPELIPDFHRHSSYELKDDIFNLFHNPTSKDVIDISIRLGVVTGNNQLNTDQITFQFNINEDTPELVAEELVSQLDIDPLYIIKISELIEQKVIQHLKPELEPIPDRPVSVRSEFLSSTDDLISLDMKITKHSIYSGFEVTPPEFSVTSSTRSSHDNSFELKKHPQSPIYDVDRVSQATADEERSMIDMLIKLMSDKDKSILGYTTEPKIYSKPRFEEPVSNRQLIKLDQEKSILNTSKRYSDFMEL